MSATQAVLVNRGRGCGAKWGGYGARLSETVGPVWADGNSGEPGLLASCYRNSLNLAKDNRLKSIAFPSISTGVYGYPFAEACEIAITEIQEFLNESGARINVILVTHSQNDFDAYSSIYHDFKE